MRHLHVLLMILLLVLRSNVRVELFEGAAVAMIDEDNLSTKVKPYLKL